MITDDVQSYVMFNYGDVQFSKEPLDSDYALVRWQHYHNRDTPCRDNSILKFTTIVQVQCTTSISLLPKYGSTTWLVCRCIVVSCMLHNIDVCKICAMLSRLWVVCSECPIRTELRSSTHIKLENFSDLGDINMFTSCTLVFEATSSSIGRVEEGHWSAIFPVRACVRACVYTCTCVCRCVSTCVLCTNARSAYFDKLYFDVGISFHV